MALPRTDVFMGLHCTNVCVCETTASNAANKGYVKSRIQTRSQTRRLRLEDGQKKTCQTNSAFGAFASKTPHPKDFYANFAVEYVRRRIWTCVFILSLLILCLLRSTEIVSIQTKFQWVPYIIGALVPCLLLYFFNFLDVRSESIQAVSSVGVQLTTTYTTGRQESYFYDVVEIQDVVINEVVTMHSVVFYLVLLMRDPTSGRLSRVIPVFKHSYPNLEYLMRVYNGIQDVLYPSASSS